MNITVSPGKELLLFSTLQFAIASSHTTVDGTKIRTMLINVCIMPCCTNYYDDTLILCVSASVSESESSNSFVNKVIIQSVKHREYESEYAYYLVSESVFIKFENLAVTLLINTHTHLAPRAPSDSNFKAKGTPTLQ